MSFVSRDRSGHRPDRSFHSHSGLLGLLVVALLLLGPGSGRCQVQQPRKSAPVDLGTNAGEAEAGREQNPDVLAAFGGAYNNPAVQAYVNEVGQKLAAQSDRRGIRFTFTVLDTPIVNALAIPGGYIYVTRGLLALVNDESELAGVLGHEVGHVAARHHAKAQERQALARAAASMAMGRRSPFMRAGSVPALDYLQSFPQNDEYEADELGIRFAARAGYEPRSMATFLATLREYSRLEATMLGRSPDSVDKFDYTATHPTAAERFKRALDQANGQIPAKPIVGRKAYLSNVDGLLYGEAPEQGFIRGRTFLHPVLRIRFEVPEGFQLFDTAERVFALNQNKALMVFDGGAEKTGMSAANCLTQVFAKGIVLQDVRSGKLNGLEGATGTTLINTPRGPMSVRLVAMRADAEHIYRFQYEAPPSINAQLTPQFAKTTASFRVLTPAEAAALKARNVKVITVKGTDTVGGLARQIPFEDYKLERFRVLNSLTPQSKITPGLQLKQIVE